MPRGPVPTETTDALGLPVTIGDWIAMGVSGGYSTYMRFGVVVGFTPSRMLTVNSMTEKAYQASVDRGYTPTFTATAYDFSLKKFIKIPKPADYVDPE